MRRCKARLLTFVLALAIPVLARAEPTPPDYVVPAPVERRLAVAAARVVVADARPTPATVPGEKESPSEGLLTEQHLALALQERMATAVGRGNAKLVVRVKLMEAREISESPPVVRAVLEISIEHEGRALTTTRGSSTLHGHFGGMALRTELRLESAVVDAFERSVLRPAFIDATNAALVEPDGPAQVEETRHDWQVREHVSSAAAHVVSAVFDGGQTYSFGARYVHDHLSGESGLFWGGYGAEARLITVSDDRQRHWDAVAGLAILRAGFAVEQAYSVELGLGAGGRDTVRALGVAGLYFSFYYVDLGFTYQFVLSPSEELRRLSGPHFGARINIPIKVHDQTVRCRSPQPCHPETLPFSRSKENGPRR